MTVLSQLRDHAVRAGWGDISGEDIVSKLGPDVVNQIIALYDQEKWDERFRKFANMFPDEYRRVGESEYHPRQLYQKHLEFFRAGASYAERCAMCANRVGKTFGMGGYEITCHLTGIYPNWWEGRRFRTAVRGWAAGKTNETTRDIVQKTLLGDIAFEGQRKIVDGSGIIPVEAIGTAYGQLSWKQGVPDLVDTVRIKHVSGQWSTLGLKSYQQGRGAFEGTAQHVVWLDEEPPQDIYGECNVRTMTTNGMIMLTFTPLEGMSDVAISFMPKELRPASMDEAYA